MSRGKLIHQSPARIGSWAGPTVPLNGCGYRNCTSGQGPVSHKPPPPSPAFAAPDIKLQAWAKPLGGGAVALVVFNRDGRSSNPLNLTFADLGLSRTVDRIAVRDLFNHSTEILVLSSTGQSNQARVVTVKPIGAHDSAAFRIAPISRL